MTRAGPEDLVALQELLRQLRGISQVREKQPGVFHLAGQVFVQIHATEGRLHADLKNVSGTGFDAFLLDGAPQQRKLLDEAKRRAAKITDE